MPALPAVVKDRSSQENFDALNSRLTTTEGKFPVKATDLAANAVEAEKVKAGAIIDEKLASPIIRGTVSAAGAKELGTGFSVEKTATGTYKITLTIELATEGVCLVQLRSNGGFTKANVAKKIFTVETFATSTIFTDISFSFMIQKT